MSSFIDDASFFSSSWFYTFLWKPIVSIYLDPFLDALIYFTVLSFFKTICSSLNNKEPHIVPVIEKNYSSSFIFYFEFFLVYASSIYSFYLHMILKYLNCDRFLILVVMPYNLGIMWRKIKVLNNNSFWEICINLIFPQWPHHLWSTLFREPRISQHVKRTKA